MGQIYCYKQSILKWILRLMYRKLVWLTLLDLFIGQIAYQLVPVMLIVDRQNISRDIYQFPRVCCCRLIVQPEFITED